MGTILHLKLKIARQSLGLFQDEIASDIKWPQPRISVIEASERPTIMNKYLAYLASKKINLTAMYDESVSVEDFKAICGGEGNTDTASSCSKGAV